MFKNPVTNSDYGLLSLGTAMTSNLLVESFWDIPNAKSRINGGLEDFLKRPKKKMSPDCNSNGLEPIKGLI